MDIKRLAELPVIIASIFLVSDVQGAIKLDLIIAFGLWIYICLLYCFYIYKNNVWRL